LGWGEQLLKWPLMTGARLLKRRGAEDAEKN